MGQTRRKGGEGSGNEYGTHRRAERDWQIGEAALVAQLLRCQRGEHEWDGAPRGYVRYVGERRLRADEHYCIACHHVERVKEEG